MMQRKKVLKYSYKIIAAILLQTVMTAAPAAPSFYTDDADPAPYGISQNYFFASAFSAPHTSFFFGPALEADMGILNNLEFHITIAINTLLRNQGANAVGLGDTLMGLKWRFLTETDYRPEMAIVPDVILPTGDTDRSLGNGRSWWTLPIWVEKHVGPWTIYGGGGYGFNSASGATNYRYGGLLVQRDFSPQVSLVGEIYGQGATSMEHSGRVTTKANHFALFLDGGHVWLINAGGYYNFTPSQSLLFSLGHSIAGTPQWVAYLGFSWNIEFIKNKNQT